MKRIAVDVGGTFTDVFLADESGRLIAHKVPSTLADSSVATVEGMREACASAGLALADLDLVFHGTTVATNTVLQRTGAKVGLITTEGFRDVLHIARHKKPMNYSLYQEIPWQESPLVPRRHRLAVRERVEPPGVVTKALDEEGVRDSIAALADDEVEAVAVCFLHSYLDPSHEQRVDELLEEQLPGPFRSLRHVVCPEYREYEAFNTVAMNAYVGPVTGEYLARLAGRLDEEGVEGDVLFMTSSGGVEPTETVSRKPVNMLLSGPVGGVVGGRVSGSAAGFENLITLDVGGTSADIGVIHEGRLRHKHWLDNEVGGFHLRLSMIDVATIGAGGGSIAATDHGGMLHVGPASAGADPGPACYGRGGAAPTVTDAQFVLGRLAEGAFLGGRMDVSAALARDAVEEQVARPLGLELAEAAAGVVRVATSHMIDSIELNSVRRGYDPRDFALVAFGGAGPLFAPDIARELEIPQIVVPRFPGIASAIGLLESDVVHAHSVSLLHGLREIDPATLAARYAELAERALGQLEADGFDEEARLLERYAECRYAGQGYELRIPAPGGPVDAAWVDAVERTFHQAHEHEYAHALPEAGVELVNIGVQGLGRLPGLEGVAGSGSGEAPGPTGSRKVWFETEQAFVETDVWSRAGLVTDQEIEGPAIIEQEDSTTLVPPGHVARAHPSGALVISTAGAGS